MRLLCLKNDNEFSFEEFVGKEIPPCAILSHTWGADDCEVTYRNTIHGTGTDKPGCVKIRLCGKQAAKNGFQYFWVGAERG
jgi:hypothetical protein